MTKIIILILGILWWNGLAFPQGYELPEFKLPPLSGGNLKNLLEGFSNGNNPFSWDRFSVTF